MQINVSQHQYFLALQSPCREEVRGQLSIIGPQLISEEGLIQERERDEKKRCWGDIRSERERPLNRTGGEGRQKLTKHTEGWSREWANTCVAYSWWLLRLHPHSLCCLCSLSTLYCSSPRVHLSCIHLCLGVESWLKICNRHVNPIHYLLFCIHLFNYNLDLIFIDHHSY